jgi:transcriptional regulator with XRE-family HTH domain
MAESDAISYAILTCRVRYASLHTVRFDGEQLKSLRLGRRLDQHALAERARQSGVGVTQSQISRYENGHEPSGRNALALASALGVDVTDLYRDSRNGGEDDEEADAPLSHDEMDLYLSLHARVIRQSQRTTEGAF